MSENFIVLIEDSPDDVVLTKTAFKQSGFFVEIIDFQDGIEAVNFLHCQGRYQGRTPTLPRAVLVDLKLPIIDGPTIIKKIKNHPLTKLVPVIALTTSVEENEIEQCYREGANSYLKKPIDFSEFLNMTKSIGQYWLELNIPVTTLGSVDNSNS